MVIGQCHESDRMGAQSPGAGGPGAIVRVWAAAFSYVSRTGDAVRSRLIARCAAGILSLGFVGSGFAGDPIQYIEGYTDKHSYQQGDTISFHVSTDSPTFDLKIIRSEMPWWIDEPVFEEALGVIGTFHAVPADMGWLGAEWPVTTMLKVSDWPTGSYAASFRTEDGTTSYHPFYVRPTVPGSISRIAFMGHFDTIAGYNTWGGKSFYQGSPAATAVSLSRPFAWDFGRGRTNWNRRMNCHLEEMGFALEYITEWDVVQDPCILRNYDVVVLVGHHEYTASRFYDALQDHHDRGGHLAFFSADDIYWQIRHENDGDLVVCYKANAEADDPLMGVANCLMTGAYHLDPLDRPAERLKALRRSAVFQYFFPTDHTVQMASHWIFEGTGLVDGDVFGSDMARGETGTLYAESPMVDILLYAFRDEPDPDRPPPPPGVDGADVHAVYYADTADYGFPDGNGGMVFSAGTIGGWVKSMATTPGSENVLLATRNIIQGMLDNPPPPPPGGPCSIPAHCPTLVVPGDTETIQEGIDGSEAFTDIVVMPGDYPETIDFGGRAITVRSAAGAESTSIDGAGHPGYPVVTFDSGEGSDSVLEGFTLTGGSAMFGGGLHVDGASPTIRSCVVDSNTASDLGGGAYVNAGAPVLIDSTFSNNVAGAGGGLASTGGEPEVTGSIFCGNTPDDISGEYADGGGNSFATHCGPCPGDVDDDGEVGFADILLLLSLWGPCSDCPEDLDGDGVVGLSELLAVLSSWGPCD